MTQRPLIGGFHPGRIQLSLFIRDYLTNAVVLGVIAEGGLTAFASQVNTEEARATLALYMLMSSVEEAKDLPGINGGIEVLQPVKPVPEAHPYIKLVPN